MKKVLKTVACFFLTGLLSQAYAQSGKDSTFTMTGKVHGVDSGKIYGYSKELKKTDSAVITKGQFVLTGKMDASSRKYLVIKPGNWQINSFIDVPQVTIDIDTTDAAHQYSNGKDNPMIIHVKQTGSPLADAYAAMETAAGKDEYFLLQSKLVSASKDSVDHIKRQMEGLINDFQKKAKAFVENYVRQNPTSFAATYLFYDYYHQSHDRTFPYLRSMMASFSGAAKESTYYKLLSDDLTKLENAQIGKPAPDFSLQKRDKSKLKLSSMRGSVVMLDLWASWCVPCRAGIPDWKKVYAKYHPKGFNIISVSIDRSRTDWIKALDKEKMPWPQVIDERPKEEEKSVVATLYPSGYIPYFVLIGKKGEILASGDDESIKKKLTKIFE